MEGPALVYFYMIHRVCVHSSSRSANFTLFGLQVLFLSRSLSTDPRTLFCTKRHIEDFHRAQIVKFVSFTGAFTDKYVVKSIKEACETVHSTLKETCQHATQFDRPCKTACFWWVKETPKDAQECDLGLCKFWTTSMSFLPVTCDAARGLQCPKEISKRSDALLKITKSFSIVTRARRQSRTSAHIECVDILYKCKIR